MSTSPKKTAPKTGPSNKGSATTASVRDVVAHASHLREVVAIVRAASVEFISRFNGVGRQLPELLLQRDGCGARPATVEAIVGAEAALEGVARELEARALALLSLSVESGEVIAQLHPVTGICVDHVVHRDHLEGALRSASDR